MYRHFWKRVIDFTLALLGILVFAIPMLLIAVLVRLDSPGPALFLQRRLGKNQKIFTIYKFRSMCRNAYEMGGVATRSDDFRITKVGAVLRRTSLDELPQLFNILFGQMSIIGPRPILPEEFEPYQNDPANAKRFEVLPGMFCTVDVYDRAADRDTQIRMDGEYAESLSLVQDFKTFFGVIHVVLSGEGVYKEEADSRFQKK